MIAFVRGIIEDITEDTVVLDTVSVIILKFQARQQHLFLASVKKQSFIHIRLSERMLFYFTVL